MQRAPEPSPEVRLSRLLRSFCAERFAIAATLATVECALAKAQQECARDTVTGVTILPARRDHLAHLEAEQERLASELAHVRLAILGASEELARERALGTGETALAMGA